MQRDWESQDPHYYDVMKQSVFPNWMKTPKAEAGCSILASPGPEEAVHHAHKPCSPPITIITSLSKSPPAQGLPTVETSDSIFIPSRCTSTEPLPGFQKWAPPWVPAAWPVPGTAAQRTRTPRSQGRFQARQESSQEKLLTSP